jgi:hypothetical protein
VAIYARRVSKSGMNRLLLLCGLLLTGCEAAPLPPLPTHEKKIDDEACAVMTAVIEDFLRPRVDASLRRGMLPTIGPVRPTTYYLIDSTMSLCSHEPVWPLLSGCIDPSWHRLAGGSLMPHVEAQLGGSLPIRCDFPGDVRYLPAHTLPLDVSIFQDEQRHASVITFSAPVLVGNNAVIFYRHFFRGGGVVWLKFSGTSWEVRADDGWQE